MDRGARQGTVQGVTKESDTTYWLNNNKNNNLKKEKKLKKIEKQKTKNHNLMALRKSYWIKLLYQ